MPWYLVRWEIELEATTPEEAAELARQVQLDPDNLAVDFRVKDADIEGAEFSDVRFDPR